MERVINENIIKKIVIETLSKMLHESVSSRVFHFLPLSALAAIAETDTLKLSKSERDSDKGIWGDGEKDVKQGMSYNGNDISPYYLSLSRTPSFNTGYVRMRMLGTKKEWIKSIARIEFDGDLLNQDFKGRPVNYFRDKYDKKIKHDSVVWASSADSNQLQKKILQRTRTHKDDDVKIRGRRPTNGYLDYNVIDRNQMSEYEDRLLSNKSFIENISKYIKRIDILIRTDITKENQTNDSVIHNIFKVLEKYKTLVNLYDSEVAFNSLAVQNRTNNPRYLPISKKAFVNAFEHRLNNTVEARGIELQYIGQAIGMGAFIEGVLTNTDYSTLINTWINRLHMTDYTEQLFNAASKEIKTYNNMNAIYFLSRKIRMQLENLSGNWRTVKDTIYDMYVNLVIEWNKKEGTQFESDPTKSIYKVARRAFQKII